MLQAPDQDCALSELLGAVAAELDLAAFDLANIEEALATAVCKKTVPADADTLQAFQGVDLLNQTLTALAALVEDVAESQPATARLSPNTALEHVPMQEMKQRLVSRLFGGTSPALADEAGSIELFDGTRQADRPDQPRRETEAEAAAERATAGRKAPLSRPQRRKGVAE